MQIAVTHITHYRYQPQVDNAKHMAYLTPTEGPHQQLLSHSLRITPEPGECEASVDVYGNVRTFFSIQEPHPLLSVAAHSLVRTTERQPVYSRMAWEAVQEQFRYHAQSAFHSAAEFVFASPCVPLHTDFQTYALPSFAQGAALLDCAWHLMGRIHHDCAYETHSTQVHTPILQALHQKRGVCQDFAHIMVACWRAMGLPARYVSGYLLTQPPQGQARLIGSDASHAWAAVFLPDACGLNGQGQWLDFDPTNNRMPGADYVTLATGRDFADVSPLRGVILGGADHILEVQVTVAPQ